MGEMLAGFHPQRSCPSAARGGARPTPDPPGAVVFSFVFTFSLNFQSCGGPGSSWKQHIKPLFCGNFNLNTN